MLSSPFADCSNPATTPSLPSTHSCGSVTLFGPPDSNASLLQLPRGSAEVTALPHLLRAHRPSVSTTERTPLRLPRGSVPAAARPQTGPRCPRPCRRSLLTPGPAPRPPAPPGEPQAAPRAFPSCCLSPAHAGRARPQSRRGRAQLQGAGSRARVGRQRPERRAPSDGGNEPGRPAGETAAGPAPYSGPVQGEAGAAAGRAGLGKRSAPPPRAAHSNKQDGGRGPSCRPNRPFKSQDVYC